MKKLKRLFTILAATCIFGISSPAYAASNEDDKTIDLDWTTNSTEIDDFPSESVIVPGDSAYKTSTIVNKAPAESVLKVSLTNVNVKGTSDENFMKDLVIAWKMGNETGKSTVWDLTNNSSGLLTATLNGGESEKLSIGYIFPTEATSGKSEEVGYLNLSFDIKYDLKQSVPSDDEDSSPSPVPGDKPTPQSPTDKTTNTIDTMNPAQKTGTEIDGKVVYGLTAILLVSGFGILLLVNKKKKTSEETNSSISEDHSRRI